MNLTQIASLSSALPVQKSDGKTPKVKRVAPVAPPEPNQSIRTPQQYQQAKTHGAKQFQAQDSIQGHLNNLSLLSGQNTSEPQVKRVSQPKQGMIGGIFQRVKQSVQQSAVPKQVDQLAQNLSAPQTPGDPPQITQPRDHTPIDNSSQVNHTAPPGNEPGKVSGSYSTATEPVKSVLPTQNITDQQATQASRKLQENLKTELKKQPPQSPAGKYYRLTKILNEYALFKQTGKGPLANDSDAVRVIEGNLHFMQQEVKKLSAHKDVKAIFNRARNAALKASFGNDYKGVAQKYANHLISDSFQKSLNKMDPKTRKAEMSKAFMKLTALDPDLADKTLKKMVIKNMTSQFDKKLQAGDSKAKEGLKKTIEQQFADFIKDNYPNLSKGDAAKALKTEFGKRLETMLKTDPNAIKKLMSKQGFADAMKDIGSALKNSKSIPANLAAEADNIVKGMTKSTVHSKLMSKAALFTGIYGLSQAKNMEQIMSGLSSVMEGSSKLSALGHLAGIANETKFMKGLISLGALGPVGEALGVASDIMGAIRESGNEDAVGMYAKITSAAAGTASAIAGIAILAGASGPAAPLVAAGAAIVGLGAAAADMFFAESDKTGEIRSTLRDVGISTSMADVYKKVDANLGVVWDDPQSMHSEFTKLKTPMERAAFINRILDRKNIWVSSGRADMVVKMLGSLTNQELQEVTKNGLHTGMLGRTLGSFPKESGKILQRLNEAWKKGDQHMAKQVNQFIKGMYDGGHHESFSTLMKDDKMGAVIKKMSPNQIKDLVFYLGKLKTQDDKKERFGVAYTDHGKSLYGLLYQCSWNQFNQVIESSDGHKVLNELKHQLVAGNTDNIGLAGRIGAWALKTNSDKTKNRLLNEFSTLLKNTTGTTSSKLADAFVGDLTNEQLKALPQTLRHRLHLAYQFGYGYSDANYQRLKTYAPEVK